MNKRLGKEKGFREILEDQFFKKYDIKEVEEFLKKKKRLDDTSFGNLQNEYEVHLETICKISFLRHLTHFDPLDVSGRHPEYNPEVEF